MKSYINQTGAKILNAARINVDNFLPFRLSRNRHKCKIFMETENIDGLTEKNEYPNIFAS